MIRFEQHLPKQTEKQGRGAGDPKMSHNIVLIVHRRPLPVLLLDSLLQLQLVLLMNRVLREKLRQRARKALEGVRCPGMRGTLKVNTYYQPLHATKTS